ncbi:hypothetical protein AB1Y20_006470 [Prymnesium parvum]|uniref:Uncharacterized protein n=1 Tax=Prymnesium parvum TaxID=97485 RepID=A0AB34IXK1_PRYPA
MKLTATASPNAAASARTRAVQPRGSLREMSVRHSSREEASALRSTSSSSSSRQHCEATSTCVASAKPSARTSPSVAARVHLEADDAAGVRVDAEERAEPAEARAHVVENT